MNSHELSLIDSSVEYYANDWWPIFTVSVFAHKFVLWEVAFLSLTVEKVFNKFAVIKRITVGSICLLDEDAQEVDCPYELLLHSILEEEVTPLRGVFA